MLGSFVIDRDSNSVICLFLDNNNISAIGVKDDKVIDVSSSFLDVFKFFNLSEDYMVANSYEGYEVKLDRVTGLYHYFKDNKEDIHMLFCMNGSNATMLSGDKNNSKGNMRKYCFRNVCIVLSELFLGSLIAFNIVFSENNVSVPLNFSNIHQGAMEVLDVNNHLIDKDMIRNYIFNSKNINSLKVKMFLYNSEFLDKVLPCYDNTPLSILSRFRHSNIGAAPFNEEDTYMFDIYNAVGYYSFDHLLHVKDFDEANFDVQSEKARILGHELVHLYQAYSDKYSLIHEAIAETVNQEFFFKNGKCGYESAYGKEIIMLKVLMEIIGPEAIWDTSFRFNSTMLEDEVRDYLSSQELKDFNYILGLHPVYDSEELATKYDRLEEILDILYFNKFGVEIESDALINAIREGEEVNRPYFCDSLIENSQSYYTKRESLSLKDAFDKGYISVVKKESISRNQYFDSNYGKDYAKFIGGENIREDIKEFVMEVVDSKLAGSVVLEDGREFTVDEAVDLNYVKVSFYMQIPTSIETYLLDDNKDSYSIFPLIPGAYVDYNSNTFKCNESYYEVISIKEKFNGNGIKFS